MTRVRPPFLAFFFALAQFTEGAGLFKIEINAGPGLTFNQQALEAFQRAADEWGDRISNPITVQIDADLRSTDQSGTAFPPNVIGSTSPGTYAGFDDLNLTYGLVRTAMVARAARPGDEVLAFLPTSDEVTANVPAGATLDKTTIGVVRANQRALGLLPQSDLRADGTILFNSAFQFDYNRFDADGVAADRFDFQTAAAHEIGHLLGFLSDVDDFDANPTLTSDNLTTLDLFRFPAIQAPSTLQEFRTFTRELRPGAESVFSDVTNEYPMSTGAEHGDGNQAGHWQDDFLLKNGNVIVGSLIGIMDPTLPPGTFETISPADFRAMELIGYNVELAIPEPSCGFMLFAGFSYLCWLRRDQRRKTTSYRRDR
jgi:hypothetical protein